MHYNKLDWEAYSRGLIPDEKRKSMENHLYECHMCLEIFLSLITRDDLGTAEKSLSPAFTSNVISSLPIPYAVEPDDQAFKRNKKTTALCYYLAVACITAIFMWTGVFDGLTGYIPEKSLPGPETGIEIDTQTTKRFGWSEKLMDKTLSVFDFMKPKN